VREARAAKAHSAHGRRTYQQRTEQVAQSSPNEKPGRRPRRFG